MPSPKHSTDAISRESGLALIEDANRWERNYAKARDELADAETEIIRLRAALAHFANPQHWAVSRRFVTPEHVWIGTVQTHPSVLAKEALDG